MLVEDDKDIADLISIYLSNQHYITYIASSLAEAAIQLEIRKPHLIICDIMLPDGKGTDWIQAVKSRSDVPVIFLSSLKEAEDVIQGLEYADDYITKPFDPDVMVARVRARLRRLAVGKVNADAGGHLWSDGRLDIHFGRLEVRVNGKEVSLPAKELQLLLHMARYPDRVFSVEQLFEQIWGLDSGSDSRTVMVHIHNLRRKIEDEASGHRYIGTVRGIGYKFLRV
nr:response regulator transcription factor [Paenibacillus lemnae]